MVWKPTFIAILFLLALLIALPRASPSSPSHSSETGSTNTPSATPTSPVAINSIAGKPSDTDPDLEPGFPVQSYVGGGTFHGGAAVNIVVGNIDADPQLEILLSVPGHGPIMAWKGDGSVEPGWPPAHWPVGYGYPSLGKLSYSSPGLQVVAGYFAGYNVEAVAYDGAGQVLPGWPRQVLGYVQTPPTLGDIDGDGIDEIFLNPSLTNVIKGYRANGTMLPGWPVHPTHWRDNPIFADLNGDGEPELLTVDDTQLYAYHPNGTPLEGFGARCRLRVASSMCMEQ